MYAYFISALETRNQLSQTERTSPASHVLERSLRLSLFPLPMNPHRKRAKCLPARKTSSLYLFCRLAHTVYTCDVSAVRSYRHSCSEQNGPQQEQLPPTITAKVRSIRTATITCPMDACAHHPLSSAMCKEHDFART